MNIRPLTASPSLSIALFFFFFLVASAPSPTPSSPVSTALQTQWSIARSSSRRPHHRFDCTASSATFHSFIVDRHRFCLCCVPEGPYQRGESQSQDVAHFSNVICYPSVIIFVTFSFWVGCHILTKRNFTPNCWPAPPTFLSYSSIIWFFFALANIEYFPAMLQSEKCIWFQHCAIMLDTLGEIHKDISGMKQFKISACHFAHLLVIVIINTSGSSPHSQNVIKMGVNIKCLAHFYDTVTAHPKL